MVRMKLIPSANFPAKFNLVSNQQLIEAKIALDQAKPIVISCTFGATKDFRNFNLGFYALLFHYVELDFAINSNFECEFVRLFTLVHCNISIWCKLLGIA